MEILDYESIIPYGKNKGKHVKDIISDKKEIFSMLKSGFYFSDEVLKLAHIRKVIRDVKYANEVVEHKKDTKIYIKDTDSLSKIIRELETIHSQNTKEIV